MLMFMSENADGVLYWLGTIQTADLRDGEIPY